MEVDSTPTPAPDTSDGEPTNVLDTVEGEIHFFRALMRARPVGINRHFHVLTIKEAIEKATKASISVEDIWRKLESCYNLDALEALEAEYEQNANSSGSSTPQPTESPKEGDNLFTHPFFRAEYSLPPDPFIDSLVVERRARATASPMSTSSPAPAVRSPSEGGPRRGRRRKASIAVEPTKADLAGLVSGDSDSSDLTQQSGDEAEGSTGQAQTPSERRATSVASGTDGGTENMEDEEEEKGEDEAVPRPRRGRKPGRGRGRGSRKRKR